MNVTSLLTSAARVRFERKEILSAALALVSLGGSTMHAADLGIPTTVVAAGGSADVSITFRSEGSAVAGLQCDFAHDSNILITSATPGSAALLAGKAVQTALLSDGKLRVMIVGFNQTFVSDGSVVDLTVQVDPFAKPGRYTLRCDNVTGVAPTGEEVEIDVRQGQVIAVPSSR